MTSHTSHGTLRKKYVFSVLDPSLHYSQKLGRQLVTLDLSTQKPTIRGRGSQYQNYGFNDGTWAVYIALKNSAYSNWVKDFDERLVINEDSTTPESAEGDLPSMIRISEKHRASVDYAFKIQRFPSKEVALKPGSKIMQYMDSRVTSCNCCGWTEETPSSLECAACKEYRWPMKLSPDLLSACPNCEARSMQLKLRCSTHRIRLTNGKLLTRREYYVSSCAGCGMEIQPHDADVPLYSHNSAISYATPLFYSTEEFAFDGLPPSTYMRSQIRLWDRGAKPSATDSVAYSCFTSLVDYTYSFLPKALITETGNFPYFSPQYGYHPSIAEGDSGHESRMPAHYL
jgi:hypothetical protein